MKNAAIWRAVLAVAGLLAATTVVGQKAEVSPGEVAPKAIPYSINRIEDVFESTLTCIVLRRCSAYTVRATKIAYKGGLESNGVSGQDAVVECSVEKQLWGVERKSLFLLYLYYDCDAVLHGMKPSISPWYWVIPSEGDEFIVVVRDEKGREGETPLHPAMVLAVFPDKYKEYPMADTLSELYQVAMDRSARNSENGVLQICPDCGPIQESAEFSARTQRFLNRTLASNNLLIREFGLRNLTNTIYAMRKSKPDGLSPSILAGSLKVVLGREATFESESMRNFLR
jgi:hypothetical protein